MYFVTLRLKKTSFLCTFKVGIPNIIQLLISHGADITSQDSHGDTPLHTAARQGSVDVVSSFFRYEKEQPLATWTMVCTKNGKGRLASEVAKKKILVSYLKDYEIRGKAKLTNYSVRK